MARLPRLDLPGVAQHIVQRGNDRQACFADDADYLHYRQELGEAALKHGCALLAYVLVTNHVYLLMIPTESGQVSKMMQAIGRRHVGCFIGRYRPTLREGRSKAALVDSDRYLLACYRYIEFNPVRAGMVTHPFDYRWSSHHCIAGGTDEARISAHPCHLALGASPLERQPTYRALFNHAVSPEDTEALGAHTQQQRALGRERFRARVQALTSAQQASGQEEGRRHRI